MPVCTDGCTFAMPIMASESWPPYPRRVCEEAGVRIAQLHGDGARAALAHLPAHLTAVYVMHADPAGHLQTAPPPPGCR